MIRLLVIADDLTGANDTGVQFARKGVPALVAINTEEDLGERRDRFQVLVVNTESRHLASAEAAERVETIVRRAMERGINHFYKKTDSTLRGNIGSELEAMQRALGKNILPFIPAFPKLERTTHQGFHYVSGNLLHQTHFATDPLSPTTNSYLPTIINQQTQVQTRVVKTSELDGWELSGFHDQGIYIFDGRTDTELRQVGELLKRKGLLGATAGSAGFAECLADLLDFKRFPAAPLRPLGRMLVVSGSVNDVALKQTSYAQAQGLAVITFPPEALVPENGAQSLEARHIISKVVELDAQGKDVVLRSIKQREDLQRYLELGQRLGLSSQHLHLRVAENVGEITSQILERTGFKLLTVFGGDTLVAIARALHWSGLVPQDELWPGIIISKVISKKGELGLVTKAGGFGAENILQRIKELIGSTR